MPTVYQFNNNATLTKDMIFGWVYTDHNGRIILNTCTSEELSYLYDKVPNTPLFEEFCKEKLSRATSLRQEKESTVTPEKPELKSSMSVGTTYPPPQISPDAADRRKFEIEDRRRRILELIDYINSEILKGDTLDVKIKNTTDGYVYCTVKVHKYNYGTYYRVYNSKMESIAIRSSVSETAEFIASRYW